MFILSEEAKKKRLLTATIQTFKNSTNDAPPPPPPPPFFYSFFVTRLLLMFHEPVLYHKLYIKNAFYLFQHVFVLVHASIVLFPNKILLLYIYYYYYKCIATNIDKQTSI